MTNLATALGIILQTLVPSIDIDRVDSIAKDMQEVVSYESNMVGLHMNETDALSMLAAVAVQESGLRESVETCKSSGDGGRSVGLGQVMVGQNWEGHKRSEICSNRKLQLKLALHVINKCYERTPRTASLFRCYASGDAAIDSAVSRAENATYLKINRVLKDYEKKMIAKNNEIEKVSKND